MNNIESNKNQEQETKKEWQTPCVNELDFSKTRQSKDPAGMDANGIGNLKTQS